MFNINDLLVENSIVTNNILECNSIDNESFFLYTLEEMLDIKKEYNQYRQTLTRTILESNMNQEVLTEGFTEFYDKVKSIISRIIKFFGSLIQKFITALNKIVMSEKYLINHEKDFAKFNNEDSFDFEGYTYTFSDTIPVCRVLKDFESGFPGLDATQLGNNTAHNKEYIDAQYQDILSKTDSDDQYDIIRGQVLQTSPIFKEDFQDELFRIYRNGENSKEIIDVNSTIVLDNMRYLKDYKKTIDSIKRTKDRIEREYTELEKFAKRMVTKGDSNATDVVNLSLKSQGTAGNTQFNVSKDTMTNIDLFINAKCNQIIEISNIHTLAFSAKLDATTEDYKQTKSILYKALSKIQKREGKK